MLTVQVGSRLVGGAAFERLTGDTAEVALLVADDYHERGIGTQLLEHLAQVARNNGIRRFQADLLGENDPALRMVRDLGWAAQMRFHDGIGRVVADLAPDTAVVRLPLMASSWMKTEIGGVVGGVHRCRTGGCGTGGRDGGVDRGLGAIGGGGVVDATGRSGPTRRKTLRGFRSRRIPVHPTSQLAFDPDDVAPAPPPVADRPPEDLPDLDRAAAVRKLAVPDRQVPRRGRAGR